MKFDFEEPEGDIRVRIKQVMDDPDTGGSYHLYYNKRDETLHVIMSTNWNLKGLAKQLRLLADQYDE